jgi:SPP1 family predicted phage head-tail adaptor
MIGELRHRITLQYQTKVSDSMGGFTAIWVTAATVFAKAWAVSSVEQVAGMQTNLIRVQKFKIRFRSVLKSSWRIKWGDRYFNITGIDPDEKNEFLFLTCKEVA